ncbi:Thymidylate synthase ThyX [compost metagenome]
MSIKVELLDYMGDDLAVSNAARVSFAKENSEFDNIKDAKLINYLAKHDHWTPFAHTALKFRVAAPLPIRTQCFKHKIGMVENEESRRYISTTPEIYVPEFFRSKPEGSVKQGSGGIHHFSEYWLEHYRRATSECVTIYKAMVEEGVCPEQARFILPQGAIVNWIWTGNLVSFANFYLKRTDSHAQKEVQEVAYQVGKLVEEIFPVSWKALTSEV